MKMFIMKELDTMSSTTSLPTILLLPKFPTSSLLGVAIAITKYSQLLESIGSISINLENLSRNICKKKLSLN